MRSTRSRSIAGAVVAALLAAACGSDSTATDTTATDTIDTATIDTAIVEAAPSTEVVVAPVTEVPAASTPQDSDDVETSGDESTPSLPANIWPEEIVETSASDGSKDVVTLAAGVEGSGVVPDGVDSITAKVTSAEGEVCEVCLWLADDDATRQRGLMGVTDLGDAVGMAFVWDQPRTGNFFMFQTPTPLSIAWFDEAGAHVGQADMEPCLVDNSATCERYTADSPYVVGIEMFGGQLAAIGIGPGSSVELLDIACA